MTDIFIKSFNRPFYLDRCITSIKSLVDGDYTIKVLDDGSPEKYLEKIQQKYPDIEILLSDNHQQKRLAISKNLETGAPIDGFEIPTNFWYNQVKNASEYFIMTEDDVWFTQKINLNELIKECQHFDIQLLKLGWLGNFRDDQNFEKRPLSPNIDATIPKKLILMNEWLMEAFFYNKFKFFSILYKLGIVNHGTHRKYWVINSILMGLFKRDYWLQIWKNMNGKVDEKRQLINAAVYYRQHQTNKNFAARLKNEAMKTTFQSSATASYHEREDAFDVNRFNHLINEAWLNGEFDPLQNFPKDISLDYFSRFVKDKTDVKAFENWTVKFKNQYRNIGCVVED